jgi:hypothetical protein
MQEEGSFRARRGRTGERRRIPGKHPRATSLGIAFSQISIVFLGVLLMIMNTSQNASATVWGPELEISTDGGGWQRDPAVATDGDKVHVVWSDYEDMTADIYYRYFDGTSWQPVQEISTDVAAMAQRSPSIAADQGKVHVAWMLCDTPLPTDCDILYAHFDGTSWQPQQEISTDVVTERQLGPSIAVDGDRVHVVWGNDDPFAIDYDIYYRYFDGTSWQPEQNIGMDPGDRLQHYPSIAVNGSEVHVAWEDFVGGDGDIYYRYYDGTSWQPKVEISTDVGSEYQYYPSIAVNGSRVHVAWEDNEGGDVDICYRYFDGTTWQPEQEISSDVMAEDQGFPSIAASGNEVHVVWADQGDGDYDIHYKHFDGMSWQPEQEISSDFAAESQWGPSIAAEAGKVHVVWTDSEDGEPDIYYREFDGTSWQAEQEISVDVGTEDQLTPSIAVSGSEVHVVWPDQEDGDWDIYYKHFDGMSWQLEREISSDAGTENQTGPSIAVDGDKLHVAWADEGDGDPDIYYRHFDGATWQPEQEISSDIGTEDQAGASIAAEGGKVYVVWQDWGGSDIDIYYRHFDGTTWQPELEISTDSGTEWQVNPSIAVDSNKAHVVWGDREGGDWDILYRQFDGTTWQAEQEISTDVGGEDQYLPSIAVNGSKLYVAWSDGEDGDFDIYYRHFDGATWLPELEISSDSGTELQTYPSIATDSDDVHVVWHDLGDGDKDLYYRQFDGATWQPEQEISSDIGMENQTIPKIAADVGKVHVVWQDMGDGDWDIYYRTGGGAIPDTTPPASNANLISPYWQATSTFDVDWTATDDFCLANITLYFRYSTNNLSWSAWEEWSYNDTISGTSASGTFSFTLPYGEGFYEFYTIANDTAGNEESPPFVADSICGYDITPPTSSVDMIVPYWRTSPPLVINASASDLTSGVATVTLWFRHSSGNSSWNPWTPFQTDTTIPWQWGFNFPTGKGFYEFYSIAVDKAGNEEAAPPNNDTICGYDFAPPSSSVDTIVPYWQGTSPLTVTVTALDNPSGIASVTLYYQYAPDNSSWGAWTPFQTLLASPWSFSFGFPDGEGYYAFYSEAIDNAGHMESPPFFADAFCGYDNTLPSSSMNPIFPYWTMLTPLPISATANDAPSGVAKVTLWFRYSVDNASWNAWEIYLEDFDSPWSWDFTFPYGVGFYELYTTAVDNASNVEMKTQMAETMVGFVGPVTRPSNTAIALTGTNLEDVTITWDLSPDDGGGNYMVAGYYVFKGTTYHPMGGWSYPDWTLLPPGTSSYVDVLAGEGDPDTYFYSICAVDPLDFISCDLEQVSKFTRALSKGINLVSVPLILQDQSIESALQTVEFDKAWTYDSSDGEWKWYMSFKPYAGDLKTINRTMGVWVDVTSDCNLTVAGLVPRVTSILLHAGWNLIGIPTFDSTYAVSDLKVAIDTDRVEGFDSFASPYHLRLLGDLDTLLAGHGYWVRVDASTVLTVNA